MYLIALNLITNWYLCLTQKLYCLIFALLYSIVIAYCFFPYMIALHSAQCIAQIFILLKKVICTLFQELYHNYITLIRNLLPFILTIFFWFNLAIFHRLTILYRPLIFRSYLSDHLLSKLIFEKIYLPKLFQILNLF